MQRVLSHHHLKMDAVWEHPDPKAYVEARGRHLELGISGLEALEAGPAPATV